MYHCYHGKCYCETKWILLSASPIYTPHLTLLFPVDDFGMDLISIFPFPFKGLKSVKSELL